MPKKKATRVKKSARKAETRLFDRLTEAQRVLVRDPDMDYTDKRFQIAAARGNAAHMVRELVGEITSTETLIAKLHRDLIRISTALGDASNRHPADVETLGDCLITRQLIAVTALIAEKKLGIRMFSKDAHSALAEKVLHLSQEEFDQLYAEEAAGE